MDSEPLYCAEQVRKRARVICVCMIATATRLRMSQIKVPDALPEILKEYTKEVIRANPTDITAWSAK